MFDFPLAHSTIIPTPYTNPNHITATITSDPLALQTPPTGTYEYYCSVGNHRAQGMKGQLIVE